MGLFHVFSQLDIPVINAILLEWYHKNKRTMPWRASDAVINNQQHGYFVLVSEIMLQQTQVKTVIPYYNRWISRWPSLKALSAADNDEVQKIWKGLGYYSRARRLLELAKRIQDTGGMLPSTVKKLMILPGIGRYTAGAIASIAFGKQAAAVDGNVLRVISRVRAIGGSIQTAFVSNVIWEVAQSLVPELEPGEWNQAVMELGATVCTPRNPSCDVCPLQNYCHSFNRKAHDIEDCNLCLPPSVVDPSPVDYPRKAPRKSARNECAITCVITCNVDEQIWYFVVKRDSSGLLADLWEFPTFPTDLKRETQFEKSVKMNLRKHCGVSGRVSTRYLGKVGHKFSHISMSYEVVHIKVGNFLKLTHPTNCIKAEWICGADSFRSLPTSTAMLKVFKLFQKDS